MTDQSDPGDLPQAVHVPRKGIHLSVVWIIPLAAALVAVGIAVQSYLSKGPTITIIFREAEGIQAGKTFVKYKDVDIGKVSAVELSDDYSKIVVTVKVDKHAERLVVEDSKFWVVKAQVTLSGISGLGTLLGGGYIGIDPGKSKTKARQFTGLDVAPIVTRGQPGREFLLRADDLGSLAIGSPLYYRRLNVGQVIAYDLAGEGKSFEIKVFVNAPYDKYVVPDSRFWQASGIDVSLGAHGLSVKTQSVLSVLVGGIAFEEPPGAAASEPAAEQSAFKLYPGRAAAFAPVETVVERYVLRFDESLRGLSVGAPVTFLGVPVGEVTDVGFEYNAVSFGLRPRVDIAVYPSRLVARLSREDAVAARRKGREDRQALNGMVERGLRAQLQTGSLISGQLFVAFENFPNAPKTKLDWTQDPVELPVVRGGLGQFEEKLMSVLTKLEQVPLDGISRDVEKLLASLDQTAQGANRVVSRVDGEIVPDVRKALGTLDQTLQRADRMAARVDGEIVPAVTKTLEDLQRSAVALQRLLTNTDAALLGPDAPAQQELREALQELSRAARGIRVLTDYLERHPETLIRGKTQEKP